MCMRSCAIALHNIIMVARVRPAHACVAEGGSRTMPPYPQAVYTARRSARQRRVPVRHETRDRTDMSCALYLVLAVEPSARFSRRWISTGSRRCRFRPRPPCGTFTNPSGVARARSVLAITASDTRASATVRAVVIILECIRAQHDVYCSGAA